MCRSGTGNAPARHPTFGHWPWWRMLLGGLAECGGMGFVLAAVPPPFSPWGVRLGVLLGSVALLGWIWNWRAYGWWSRLSLAAAFSLLVLAMGMRGLHFVLPDFWVWAAPLQAAYLLAWVLPATSPGLSRLIYREQVAPRSRLGRGCLSIALAVGGTAGALGASLGMFGSRFEETSAVGWVIGVIGSAVAVGIASVNAWELWRDRPWRSQGERLAASPPPD